MVAQNLSRILENHVVFGLEGMDRMYLNLYQPRLQIPGAVAGFFKYHRKTAAVSSFVMAPISKAFQDAIQQFVATQKVERVIFRKRDCKEEIAKSKAKDFGRREGVYLVGSAQEKFSAFRTHRVRDEKGESYPRFRREWVLCNHYYFYLLDEDFGPMFIKYAGYFPYTGRVCLNGHEYAKRQLDKEGIAYEALDNGFLSCANPERLQEIMHGLTQDKIEAVVNKWLARLPNPFTQEDMQAGYTYALSMLQMEFSLTQVFDSPASGRQFFEEVIRENLDLGRPDRVSLVFDRRATRRTPGVFCTRVITDGVFPSLHVRYKHTRIKQYFKEGRALRTETTINDTRDFYLGKRLIHLPALREIGFSANRRLLDVQRLSHDCHAGIDAFHDLVNPLEVDGQRASALRFGEPRAMALLAALCLFALLPRGGFTNRELRTHVANLLGSPVETYTPGKMTYDLRRLRLRGLIRHIPHTHRYEVTQYGQRMALYLTKVYARVLRPGCSVLDDHAPNAGSHRLHQALTKLDRAVDDMAKKAKLTA